MLRFKLLRGRHYHGRLYKKGDIVETDTELDRKFGSNKFQRVEGLPAVVANDTDTSSDGLDNMTVDELKKYAEEEGIDLGPARLKAELIGVIREASEE